MIMKKTYDLEVQSTDARGRVRLQPVKPADGMPEPDARVALTLSFDGLDHGYTPGQRVRIIIES